MQSTQRRRACIECFQRKVRCEWIGDLHICVRCQRNGLECRTPSPSQAPLRNPIRDVLSTFENRLRTIEGSASSARQPGAPERPSAAREFDHTLIDTFVELSENDAATASEILKASHEPSLPWRMLLSDTRTAPSLLGQAGSLAEEEVIMKVSTHAVAYDILKEFPLLGNEDVILMARTFAFELPFSFTHWPSLRADLDTALQHKYAASAGHLACILMYLAFGSSRLSHISRLYGPDLFFTKALNFLSQLVLEQSIPALKALTLMVHYLQGSSHPTQCYTLLGAASNLALALGLHKSSNNGSTAHFIERQEGLRAWWLCYITQRTLTVIYNLPMMDYTIASNTPVPEPFRNEEASFSLDPEGKAQETAHVDEEAVGLFLDVIATIRARDSILARGESTSVSATAEFASLTDMTGKRDQSKSYKSLIRSKVSQLARLNSTIVLHHLLDATSTNTEAINAAVRTIRLIVESQKEGLVMCLWMWLYYAFTAIAILFSHVVRHPLGRDTGFHLALISDVQGICAEFATLSPAARRVLLITKDMDTVGFNLIKTASKKRALERDGHGDGMDKRGRFESLIDHAHGDFANEERPQNSAEGIAPLDFPEGSLDLPTTFNWEDWEAWFGGTETSSNT